MKIELSVVIPCYNEEQNIRLGALDKVVRYLEKQSYKWEMIIVDDGSKDESVSLIKEFIIQNSSIKLIESFHQGKAGTVVRGMLSAQGAVILFTDLDQATPVDQLEKLFPWVHNGFDVVIGSRKGIRKGAPLFRRVMGPGFMFVRNLILGLGVIQDTQCGFKLFTRKSSRDIFSRLRIFSNQKEISGPRVTAGFDVEVLFIGIKLGYKIKEVAVDWHYVDTRRVSPLMDSLDALIDIVKIRIKDLRKEYESKVQNNE